MASTTSFGNTNAGLQAGAIYGSVNTAFHLTPERSETLPCPSAVIPFARDIDFVERGAILDQLDQKCATPGSWTALVGLGGVGKSQLAIEYAYRIRERSPDTWVLWVHASNAARFEQSFRDVADCVRISERRDPKANIFKLVHDWLRSSKNPWLLVLDNVDDARFLLDVQPDGQGEAANLRGTTKPLREYLPHCEHGLVLITTRAKEAALKLVEQRDIIAVEPMNEAQAQALLEKKLGIQENNSDISELAAILDYMPLAIVQATAYISQRAPRYSVAKYLEEFKKSERKQTTLLSYDQGQIRRDWEAKNSITVTWQISFEHIQRTRPTAADLLSLMSFFDRQGIPEMLLRTRNDQIHAQSNQQEGQEDEDVASQSSTSDDGFEDDVVALRNFSFISTNTDGTAFEMHALVQLATRRWLQANNKLERWKQQFISNLSTEFPIGDFKNWERCQALFSHVKSAMVQKPEGDTSLLHWAKLMYRAAFYMLNKGNITSSETPAVESMRVYRKLLGQEHNATLLSTELVGRGYKLAGRWDDAERLLVEVVGTRTEIFGADHVDTLVSKAELALIYRKQGRWGAAEELGVQVVETCKKKLGVDHSKTLASMSDLALTYRRQGRLDAAEKLGVQVVEVNKRMLGEDHYDTLTDMANLALIYWDQGRWDASEELEVKVLESHKKTLGVDHPETLAIMSNLASTYRSQGKCEAAEELDMKVLEMRKKTLDADHPDMLLSMSNLAATYWKQGRWDAAEELDVKVAEISKKKLGIDHPETLNNMVSLAVTWNSRGRHTEALELMRECVQRRANVIGVDHPHYQQTLAELARWEAKQAEASKEKSG